MKNKFRILKILSTVIIFGFLLSFSLKRFNNKPMEKVSVKMTQTKNPVYFIDEKDVKELVKKSNPTKRIGDINIPELEKKLNQLPAVDSANVYLNLNGNLNLDIKQRVPAFRLNKDDRDFYVDEKGVEFPTSKNYSFPCMLVMGNVKQSEYVKLAELISKIDRDEFSKKYFIGISKKKGNYELLTSEGYFKVEIGDLENIDLKVKGFKAFVEKYLIHQDPEKYTKVSVKYDNQIVTTLNPHFKENDSIISVGKKELAKLPLINKKKEEAEKKPFIKSKEESKQVVKKDLPKPKTVVNKTAVTQKKPDNKPKAKVKIE
ncbi:MULTISPECIES: cell division protein FtsQ/DivIB [unclassified Kaistella]|uniref:cell division protein FtsQ/DivIB n=1 Tax=unclassified Kaistella TaxID=2762626 RepID=UPI00273670B3|nr:MULTISPECIES: cell division protein FtsQ [unclassified Kaistella]MDP2452942.1 cell division protein FtsQ [Kaistella sp. SH11-4b]MDP2455851.1 cell division protein FtsQ [Kaistella sp. SH40-3]MDP2458755.1 cell division protein FtsQ [Kaistella sp. SH19-2b]